jgi:hypothetical protein
MKNVGGIDRILRFIVGALLLIVPNVTSMALFATPLYYWIAMVVGVVMIGTALLRFCPVYPLLGINTCSK